MPRASQIDINLERVTDPAVRDALRKLQDFCNGLVAKGLDTDGEVKAKTFATQAADGFSVDATGQVTLKAVATYGSSGLQGGAGTGEIPPFVRTMVREGSLNAGASRTLAVEGKVLAAIGWSQLNGDDDGSGGLDRMVAMGVGTAIVANTVYFSETASSKTNQVRLSNDDGVHANHYRVVIFYTDEK